MQKLHCGMRMQAIWKIIYIVVYSFMFALSYIFPCVLCFVQSLVCFVLYSFLCAGGQSEPCYSLFKHFMEEQWFFLHHASNFDFVFELDCDNSWQIDFVIIKSHADFIPIYF